MLNIDSLHRELDKRERRKLKIYDKILLKCHSRIKISTKKSGDTFCFFVIPTYVFGVPLFDISGCVLYIVENLIKNGFDVKYTHPNLIFISWHRKQKNQLQLNNNKLVRKALSLSINRKEIVEKVTRGGQLPAFSFTPPDPNSYYPPTSLDYNPELAKKLIEEAGYSEENFPIFELLYNTSEGHQKLAQAIQQTWKRNLNIDVQLTNTDWKVYLSKQSIGDYMVARAGWIGDYVDPKTFLDMMVTGRGNNQTGWSNSQYDDLLVMSALSSSLLESFYILYKAE